MSHRTIIINRVAAPNGPGVESDSEEPVEYSVSYTPPDNLTPAQIGQKVRHFCAVLDKLDGPDTE